MESVHIHVDKPKSNYQLLLFVIPVIAFAVILVIIFQLLFNGSGGSSVRGVSTEMETSSDF